MTTMKEMTEGFGIGFTEPTPFGGIIEKLMIAAMFMHAGIFPPFPREIKSLVRVWIRGDSHQFVANVNEVDFDDYFLHKTILSLRSKTSEALKTFLGGASKIFK